MLTLETAWRNYRGAARDQAAAEEKLQGSRQAWAHTLLEQMAERYETAREELGLDVTKEKVLLQIGVPCITCLKVISGRRDGHGLFVGGADSAAPAYAECDSPVIDPSTADMPVWPALPKAATA
jgi:hypothetical protein